MGEVVVVHDEHHPRSLWKLGKVTDVIASNDGQVRGAVVKVMTNGKPITLRRPICDRILENHPYGCILHFKYLALKSSLKFQLFTHSWL